MKQSWNLPSKTARHSCTTEPLAIFLQVEWRVAGDGKDRKARRACRSDRPNGPTEQFLLAAFRGGGKKDVFLVLRVCIRIKKSKTNLGSVAFIHASGCLIFFLAEKVAENPLACQKIS